MENDKKQAVQRLAKAIEEFTEAYKEMRKHDSNMIVWLGESSDDISGMEKGLRGAENVYVCATVNWDEEI